MVQVHFWKSCAKIGNINTKSHDPAHEEWRSILNLWLVHYWAESGGMHIFYRVSMGHCTLVTFIIPFSTASNYDVRICSIDLRQHIDTATYTKHRKDTPFFPLKTSAEGSLRRSNPEMHSIKHVGPKVSWTPHRFTRGNPDSEAQQCPLQSVHLPLDSVNTPKFQDVEALPNTSLAETACIAGFMPLSNTFQASSNDMMHGLKQKWCHQSPKVLQPFLWFQCQFQFSFKSWRLSYKQCRHV